LAILCVLDLSFEVYSGGVSFCCKKLGILFFIWTFIPIFLASYTWSLIKTNIRHLRYEISSVSSRLIISYLKFFIFIASIFSLEMILLIFKACSYALSKYFKVAFVTSLAIITFFDKIIRMYIDVIIYNNLVFKENILNVGSFLSLIILLGIFTSKVFQKIYFENLKSEHGILLIKEKWLFTPFFTIIIVFLAFYLFSSYENNYLDLNGYNQNRSREVF
jgi:hypothetical protein